jgi:phospholipid/cholesterol/gamma-HCH transport system substrate-binding protein
LTLSLDRNLREQVRRDSKAQIRTMGLLGDRYIDITPGTPKGAVLVDGDTIPVEPAVNYEAVLARASAAVTDVVGLTHDLQTITGGIVKGQGTLGQLLTNRGLYDQMSATLLRTDALLARVQNSKGTLARFLDDSTLYVQMVGAVTSTDSLIAALNNKQGTLGKLLNDDSLYKNLVGITYTMVGVANGADSIMKMIAAGKGTAGRMLTDQSLYDSLNKLVNDMSTLLGDIRKDPRKYFKGLITIF